MKSVSASSAMPFRRLQQGEGNGRGWMMGCTPQQQLQQLRLLRVSCHSSSSNEISHMLELSTMVSQLGTPTCAAPQP